MTLFKIILKLVEFAKSLGQLENFLGHSEHSRRCVCFVTSFIIILVEFFTSCGQLEKKLQHLGHSASFVTSFKIILKLVDFYKLWAVRKNI